MRHVKNAVFVMLVLAMAVVTTISVKSMVDVRGLVLRLMATIPTPNDAQINGAVSRLLRQGRASELYLFYADEAGSQADAATFTIGALENKWSVSKAMAFAWWARSAGVKGRPSPGEVQSAGAVAELGGGSISMAEYVRAEQTAEKKTISDMETQLSTPTLTRILLHERETNRRFAVRFGDALDW